MQELKIIGLKAENIKRIKAVELKPDGKTVILGGDNEQGKSSVLDSILYGLGGASNICGKPVRAGEKKGSVEINLGDIIVTRKFTEAGTNLTITNKDGDIKRSPQAILDNLVGKLAFDPLAFARMEARPQRDTLAKLAGLDFAALDREYQEAYAMRTDANRDATRIKSSMLGKAEIPNVPEAEIESEEIVKRLEAAQRHNGEIRTAKAVLEDMADDIANTKKEAQAVMDLIADLSQRLDAARNRAATVEKLIKHQAQVYEEKQTSVSAMVPTDESPIRAELSTLSETNAAIRANADLRKKKQDLAKAEETIRNINANMEAIASKKSKLISSAKYPLEGLTVSDDAVLYRGIPIKQASSAEQIKISTAIAMALNPTLRVMLIKDGAYLDQKSLAAIQEMAVKNNVQLWIERVGDGSEVSVVIEDGSVKENRMQQPSEKQTNQ